MRGRERRAYICINKRPASSTPHGLRGESSHRRAIYAQTPTEDLWEQMPFSFSALTLVTLSVKDVNSKPTVPGYAHECQRNHKILSGVFLFLITRLNNQQRCYISHSDKNTLNRRGGRVSPPTSFLFFFPFFFFHNRAGTFLNGNKTHSANSCVCYSFGPGKFMQGFGKTFHQSFKTGVLKL